MIALRLDAVRHEVLSDQHNHPLVAASISHLRPIRRTVGQGGEPEGEQLPREFVPIAAEDDVHRQYLVG